MAIYCAVLLGRPVKWTADRREDFQATTHDRDQVAYLEAAATSGVVLSTVRYAADADYGLVVLEDCCADQDAETHSVLIRKVFPRQATVATLQDFLAAVGA